MSLGVGRSQATCAETAERVASITSSRSARLGGRHRRTSQSRIPYFVLPFLSAAAGGLILERLQPIAIAAVQHGFARDLLHFPAASITTRGNNSGGKTKQFEKTAPIEG